MRRWYPTLVEALQYAQRFRFGAVYPHGDGWFAWREDSRRY